MRNLDTREHLIEVAAELFSRHGYHASGIDRLIAEAGIAKTTLYRHFRSKDDLIIAVLRHIDKEHLDALRVGVDALAPAKEDKLLAVFDYLESHIGDKNFSGCPFICAAVEFGDRSSPIFQEAAVHKRMNIAYFEELAHGAGLPSPRYIAEQINLLHEGAITVAYLHDDPNAVRRAKYMAAGVIAAAEAEQTSSAA